MSLNSRAAILAALLAGSTSGLSAQPGGAPGHAASSAGAPASLPTARTANAAPGVYRSAFEGYRSFNDQPVGSWRAANDLVGRIGGWQAYAREAQGAPASAGSTAAPSPQSPASHPGGGHKMP